MTSKALTTLPQRELAAAAGRAQIAVSTPALQPLPPVGGPINGTLMRWRAGREAKTYRRMAESTRAQTEFVNTRRDLASALVATARVIAELNEVPLMLQHDAQVRHLRRDAELATVQREAAEARYGRDATLDEIAELRTKQRKKTAAKEKALMHTLAKAKQELEALGRDTGAIDDAMSGVAHVNGAG
jgi:hypothetical protein